MRRLQPQSPPGPGGMPLSQGGPWRGLCRSPRRPRKGGYRALSTQGRARIGDDPGIKDDHSTSASVSPSPRGRRPGAKFEALARPRHILAGLRGFQPQCRGHDGRRAQRTMRFIRQIAKDALSPSAMARKRLFYALQGNGDFSCIPACPVTIMAMLARALS